MNVQQRIAAIQKMAKENREPRIHALVTDILNELTLNPDFYVNGQQPYFVNITIFYLNGKGFKAVNSDRGDYFFNMTLLQASNAIQHDIRKQLKDMDFVNDLKSKYEASEFVFKMPVL